MERRSVLAVWLADFSTAEQFSAYLEERYDERNVGSPLSAFAAESGIAWYDHDFLEADYRQPPLAIAELLKPFSYAESFVQAVVERATTAEIARAHAAILLYDFEYAPAGGLVPANSTVSFLGNFSYTRT